jgi:hypothetical protein
MNNLFTTYEIIITDDKSFRIADMLQSRQYEEPDEESVIALSSLHMI